MEYRNRIGKIRHQEIKGQKIETLGYKHKVICGYKVVPFN